MSRQSVRWPVPLRTQTTANARKGAGSNRWATHERNSVEKDAVTLTAPKARLLALPHPVVVTLTRVHPPKHELDAHDNLPAALKAVVDAVAPLLGFASDRDEQVQWRYRQRKGKANEWAVEVEVVGPCRAYDVIRDVPEGYVEEALVEPRVVFTGAGEKALALASSLCQCPADEDHYPGCEHYRPGPKVAP